MKENNLEQVLKEAVLLERQSQRFYEDIAGRTEHEAVKKVFSAMGAEEKGHEKTLLRQYKQYLSNGRIDSDKLDVPDIFSEHILSDSILKEIEAASYEGAAISAAIGLEQAAVDRYAREAERADSREEKQFFRELSAWEETHLQFLANLHRKILQDAWFDGLD